MSKKSVIMITVLAVWSVSGTLLLAQDNVGMQETIDQALEGVEQMRKLGSPGREEPVDVYEEFEEEDVYEELEGCPKKFIPPPKFGRPRKFDDPKVAGKAMTKSQIADHLARKAEITKKTATQILDEFAALAYKEAKNTFVVPGIGELVLAHRKARLGRNPCTGEAIKIPAKKVVKFRVAKAAKDAILGEKK